MILTTFVALLAVACFAFAFVALRVVIVARRAMRKVYDGLAAIMDSELDDDTKEVRVRQSGLGLIVSAFDLFWRFAVILAAAASPIFLSEAVLPVRSAAVFGLMLSWEFIFIVTLGAFAASALLRRLKSSGPGEIDGGEAVNRYSSGERILHMFAFAGPWVLKTASRLEDRLVSGEVQESGGPPIFVTSLARGGTTAVLNALHDMPEIATHTYRDMPFLTAPILWDRLAGRGKRQVQRQERAHGDGLEIDLDSPEAFEEVLWKMFWPHKFSGGVIGLWQAEDRDAAAEYFLERHMQKIIAARGRKHPSPAPSRYCSKNNANIARIPFLAAAYPDCKIVVPVRRPECHAASLMRQHQNFLKLQGEDDFVRRYMRDIGHYEFGLLHQPIAFEGFDRQKYNPERADYWINYWAHAFEHVLEYRNQCHFVFQDALRSQADDVMISLCDDLGVTPVRGGFSHYFRSAPDVSPRDAYDPKLFARANDIYEALRVG